MPPNQWRDLISQALAAGAIRHGLTRIVWNISGRCEAPPTFARSQRWEGPKGNGPLMELEMIVPCRRCKRCLAQRAAEWAARARVEFDAAGGRTWFGTLTLSPDAHYASQCIAMNYARLRASGEWGELDEDTRFRLRVQAIGPELQRYLKRVRMESGAKLRYLLVAEAHQSGMPHFHILIHEVDGAEPVRHATLQSQWRLGFSNFKLAKDKRASLYVTKYLTKSARARVRASRAYGRAEDRRTNTIVNGVKREHPTSLLIQKVLREGLTTRN